MRLWQIQKSGRMIGHESDGRKTSPFKACEAFAVYEEEHHAFYLKPKRPEDEIDINKEPDKAKELFTKPNGSRAKEWENMQRPDKLGRPAIRIHRGAIARALRKQYANRVTPSRWHDKWKDMGDDFDNEIPK